MQYTHLGRTGLSVSRLCLGTMNFGWTTEKADAFTVMDSALDKGVNFFDTANVYGRTEKGKTEGILGDWFAQGGGRREKTVLATKVYGEMGATGPTTASSPPSTSATRSMPASSDSRPITSISTSSTTSTAPRRGTKSGRRWKSPCSRARSFTPAAPTSPAGTSPRPRPRPRSATTPASSPSSRSTT